MEGMVKKAGRVTPGSGLAGCLDNCTIEWHKEGKIHPVLAKLRLNCLYYIQLETSKHASGFCSVRMGTCPAYESIMWGVILMQVTLRAQEGNQEGQWKSSIIEQVKND